MSQIVSSASSGRKPKLLDQVREVLRANYYSIRTEEAYLAWIKGGVEVARFLSALAVKDEVSPSTQNQAFSALLFLYRQVQNLPLDDLGPVKRARRTPKTPVVLTKTEARTLLGPHQLCGLH